MGNLKTHGEEKQDRLRRDDLLYQQYGEPLEEEHEGEYVAISTEGKTITGNDDIEVARKAIDQFGSGNFTLRRIGEPSLGKWRVTSV